MGAISIRPARPDDVPRLRELERRAGQAFRTVGLDAVADDEPPTEETLSDYIEAGRAWVAASSEDEPLGYLIVDEIDGATHVEQVSVAPEHQGRGIGRALIGAAEGWARAQRHGAMTLTTFDDVPWNRPLYEHLGFQVVAADRVGPGLARLRAREAAHGLDPQRRVVMRRPVG